MQLSDRQVMTLIDALSRRIVQLENAPAVGGTVDGLSRLAQIKELDGLIWTLLDGHDYALSTYVAARERAERIEAANVHPC